MVHFSKARTRTRDLALITDTEFKLIEDESSHHIWTFKNVKGETRKEILKLLNEGTPQKDIPDILKIDKAHVSRTRKRAIQDGLLTEKNSLTEAGRRETGAWDAAKTVN